MADELSERWGQLTTEAVAQLQSSWAEPLARARGFDRVLCLRMHPSFASPLVVQLLRGTVSPTESFWALTRCRWDIAADEPDFATLFSWVKRATAGRLGPTLQRHLAVVDTVAAERWYAAVSAFAVPLTFDSTGGIDGTTYELVLGNDLFTEVKLSWWGPGPPQWRPLTAVSADLLRAVESVPAWRPLPAEVTRSSRQVAVWFPCLTPAEGPPPAALAELRRLVPALRDRSLAELVAERLALHVCDLPWPAALALQQRAQQSGLSLSLGPPP